MSGTLSDRGKKRLVKDVAYMYKNPLHDQHIYYVHDMENINEGYAMIIGTKDTPYYNGMYFFKFIFPYDYPHKPPMVKFIQLSDFQTKVRIHPNLYQSGKVCLSLLNTWHGEQWSSCQGIHSILLQLVSILTDNPLLHEPNTSMERHKKSILEYNKIVAHANIMYGICGVYQRYRYLSQYYSEAEYVLILNFKDTILSHLKKQRNEIIQQCRDIIHSEEWKSELRCIEYGFKYMITKEKTCNVLVNMYEEFSKEMESSEWRVEPNTILECKKKSSKKKPMQSVVYVSDDSEEEYEEGIKVKETVKGK